MIKIKFKNPSKPMLYLKELYENALKNDQKFPEACAISSSDHENSVDSRFVNIKYIFDNELIFFSNYKSPKAKQFEACNKVSALFFWSSIYIQIRMKGLIEKTDSNFSDKHFVNRAKQKNIIAKISNQSEEIDSYDTILKKFDNEIRKEENLERPDYWGGFSFKPYYFEFWEGNESRINKREVYEKHDHDHWKTRILQP